VIHRLGGAGTGASVDSKIPAARELSRPDAVSQCGELDVAISSHSYASQQFGSQNRFQIMDLPVILRPHQNVQA
jgi:hypothetical protein